MIERLSSTIFQNIPEILQIGHGNPLNISPIAQLIVIVVLVAIMATVNTMIRRRGKSNLYPVLYTFLGLSLLSIFYYCFQSNPIPEGIDSSNGLGWFYDKSAVGIGWFIVSVISLIGITYFLQCAIMQATAEISVHAGLSEGKLWKEWKWAMTITMLGVAIASICQIAKTSATNWVTFITLIVLFLFCFGKIIADSIRGKSVWRCILIGCIFLIGLIAVIMLALECAHATFLAFIVCLVLFSTAKASKKEPKKIK